MAIICSSRTRRAPRKPLPGHHIPDVGDVSTNQQRVDSRILGARTLAHPKADVGLGPSLGKKGKKKKKGGLVLIIFIIFPQLPVPVPVMPNLYDREKPKRNEKRRGTKKKKEKERKKKKTPPNGSGVRIR